MNMQDFIRTAALPPDWLQKVWAGTKRHGLNVLTLDDINAEVDAAHQETELALNSEAR